MLKKIYFLCVLSMAAVQAEPIVVTIDNMISKIDKNSSCELNLWNNKLENSCLCCILKHAEQLKQGKSAHDIIKTCIEQGHCTEAIINGLIKSTIGDDYSMISLNEQTEETLQKLIAALVSKSVLVQEVEQADGIFFDQYGNFTAESLPYFLAKMYADGKLPDVGFQTSSCIKAVDAMDQKGGNTLQLFLINSTCDGVEKKYVLKEIKSREEEVVNLSKAKAVSKIQDIIYPNTIAGEPIIILPIAYLSYQYQGKRHVLSLMHRAEGKSLGQFMKDYKVDPSDDNAKRAMLAYENVGEKLSRFHRKFMQPGRLLTPTAFHGDFHIMNVFVTDAGDVSFIDNERLARSFSKPHDIANDAVYLFYIGLGPLVTPPAFFQGFDTDKWVYMTLKSFIIGYLTPYAENERKEVLKGLKDRFIHAGYYINKAMYGDFGGHYLKYKNAIDQVFSELYKTYEIE